MLEVFFMLHYKKCGNKWKTTTCVLDFLYLFVPEKKIITNLSFPLMFNYSFKFSLIPCTGSLKYKETCVCVNSQ